MARLEIGEVLLTEGICGVEVQVVLGVVPWNVPARDQISKGITRRPGEFAGFTKGQDALRVEGNGKFATKARFNLGDREPQAGCHGFGDVEMKSHDVPRCCFDSTLSVKQTQKSFSTTASERPIRSAVSRNSFARRDGSGRDAVQLWTSASFFATP